MLTYNTDNLADHDVTVCEVDEVLNDPRTVWLDLGVSNDGCLWDSPEWAASLRLKSEISVTTSMFFTQWMQESIISRSLMMPNKETPRERHERLSKRGEKIRTEAGERLTKDAVIQCRIEPAQMGQLQKLARAKGLSISALTRMWLLERLQLEKPA